MIWFDMFEYKVAICVGERICGFCAAWVVAGEDGLSGKAVCGAELELSETQSVYR